jgi:hypothetical protein
MLVANLGINADNGVSAATISIVETIVADALAAAPGAEGATIVGLVNIFANATTHPELGAAATAFNANMMAAVNYAELDDTLTIPRNPPEDALDFTIARQDAAGLSVMRLLGDTDVRIDFTNPAHQVTGLDFDQDGTIELNGTERNVAWLESNVATIGANHSNFEAVDAYPRNPLDHTDTLGNFLGDIWFDGEGFDGDGVSTNGNIFLGGLGTDTASAATATTSWPVAASPRAGWRRHPVRRPQCRLLLCPVRRHRPARRWHQRCASTVATRRTTTPRPIPRARKTATGCCSKPPTIRSR